MIPPYQYYTIVTRMSSHGTVVDHRSGAGVRLRELDDSRRGARFSNRKEDKLLERKLTYLNNQVRGLYCGGVILGINRLML